MQVTALRRTITTLATTLGGAALVAGGAYVSPVLAVFLAVPVLTMVLLQVSAVRNRRTDLAGPMATLLPSTVELADGPSAEVFDLAAHRAARGPQQREERTDGGLAPVIALPVRQEMAPMRMRAHG